MRIKRQLDVGMMEIVRKQGSELTAAVDAMLRDTPPWKVVLGTTGATLSAAYVYSQFNQRVCRPALIVGIDFRVV